MGLLDTEKEFFFFLFILSTLFGVSIKRITLSWAIIEINFLIFLPLLRFNASFFYSSISLNHFFQKNSFFEHVQTTFIFFFILMCTFSLLWKLGVPPFHLWFMSLSPE